MALLSILVPIYNVEKYLEQCLESLINQTYTDIEIICVDDGSTDHSSEILDRMAKKDTRLKVIHKSNSGYGISMNLALAEAKGEYIGIVESDDYISPDMYECLMSRMYLSEDIDVVKSAHYAVENEQPEKINLFEAKNCEKVIGAKNCKTLFAIPCNIWSAIYRKNFLDKNNIKFLETPGASYQDTSFYFKSVIMAEKIVLTNNAYYYYRTDNAESSVNSNDKIFFVCDEIAEVDRYMKEHKIIDPYYVGVRNAFMFRAYYWNYNRLNVLLKSAFYQKFKEELIQMQTTEEFDSKYWTKDYWNAVVSILADMEHFFWSSVWNVTAAVTDSYTVQKEIYADYLEEYIKKQDRILIYGAGVYGKKVYSYLCELGVKNVIEGFVVSEGTKQIPSIYSVTGDREKILLIVAVAEKKQMPMIKKAKKLGFSKILRADEILQNKIKNMEK